MCYNPIEIRYLSRMRLGFSHFCYYKFNHGFLDAIDSLCSCITAIKNTIRYLLQCPNFLTARNTYLNEIVDRSIIDKDKIKTFRYDNPAYSINDNKLIIDASIKYIFKNKRFGGPIFQVKELWLMHSCQNETTQLLFYYYRCCFTLSLLHYQQQYYYY